MIVVLTHVVVLQTFSALTQNVVVIGGAVFIEPFIVPEPAEDTPQEPVYQYHKAFAPNVPPVKLKVDVELWQIGNPDEADVAATELEWTMTVVLTHVVVLQTFSALTQYVVVIAGLREGEFPV